MIDPKIYLGIDNCFALKRWTTPAEWAKVIKDLGMYYVEAVPDLEAEPLLTPKDYQKDWIHQVKEVQAKEGVKTVMIYSNDSTYDTTGFAHPDPRVRRNMVDKWFTGFCEMAAGIGADIGYFVHGLSESVMYDKAARMLAQEHVTECMVDVNRIAEEAGVDKVALEQMYTPHQPPFTINTMIQLMQTVKRRSGKDFYVTEDVGHHCPFYNRPDPDQIREAYQRYQKDGYISIWLGSRKAQELFTQKAGDKIDEDIVKAIMADMDENVGMFSTPRDTDCYEWLKEMGCYSPVIHIQQTDGTYSSHKGFTAENNAKGKIHPVKILEAIQESYNRIGTHVDMPKPCEDIYLIQELYLSTKDIGYQGLHTLKESTDYLRKFIPRDGMTISELLEYNKGMEK